MQSYRERWDHKYGPGGLGRELEPADPFLTRALEELEPKGAALDLAAGAGRHAIALARRGWHTWAWDVSPVGLELLAGHARSASVQVQTRALDIEAEGSWPGEPFELVLACNFLLSRLQRDIAELVRPGGHLAYATFTRDWTGEKPSPAFRLDPAELARGLPRFETVLHEERGGRAGILARRIQGELP